VENNNGGSKMLGRRRTLQLLGVGSLSATGLLALAGCDNKKEGGGASGATTGSAPAAGGNTCATSPDETSKTMRKTLQYKEAAADATKACKGCAQYNAGAYGDCGGCKLFTGPVKPEGGCLSFAPKAG
jgi:hypothetical protein